MATLSSGDTLSLNSLGSATGQATKSLSAAKGNTTGPIAMSSFAIDSVDSISGYTYIVEDTSEAFTLQFSGAGSNFTRICSRGANFTWSIPTQGGFLSLSTDAGATRTFSVSSMNPQSPSAQTSLQGVVTHVIRVVFADGFNDHATGYNTNKDKTVYSVDSYDGNTVALCLTTDSPVVLSDGTTIQAGDLEEGMKLKGYSFNGLGTDSEFKFLEWSTDELDATEKEVTVVNLIYSFSEKYYSLNGGEVTATAEHPLMVKDVDTGEYKFKEILTIKSGDKLIKHTESGLVEVEILTNEVVMGTVEIISIDVEQDDTYLVNGYVTHNKDEGNSQTDFDGPTAPTSVSYSHPNLSWSGGTADTNSVGCITGYDVQVSTVSNFSSLTVDQSNWDATSMQLAGGFVSAGTYYARVRNVQSGLKSGWTTTGAFSVTL